MMHGPINISFKYISKKFNYNIKYFEFTLVEFVISFASVISVFAVIRRALTIYNFWEFVTLVVLLKYFGGQ